MTFEDMLRAAILYNAETGEMFWRERPREHFATGREHRRWNTQRAGQPAMSGLDKGGYKRGAFEGRHLKAHRVAWFLAHGEWPDSIDHINRDRADNRLENLRAASRNVQAWNVSKQSTAAKSRYIGVSKQKAGNWFAYIETNGKRSHLGSFMCETAAAIARIKAELTTRGEVSGNA